MGAIVFLIYFWLFLAVYYCGCCLVWFFKYRKKMTFSEFERKYDL